MLHDQQWDPEVIPMPCCLVAGSFTNALLPGGRKSYQCPVAWWQEVLPMPYCLMTEKSSFVILNIYFTGSAPKTRAAGFETNDHSLPLQDQQKGSKL